MTASPRRIVKNIKGKPVHAKIGSRKAITKGEKVHLLFLMLTLQIISTQKFSSLKEDLHVEIM